VIVGDTMWVDFVQHGFAPSHVVWFSKLQYVNTVDPSVSRGWQDFQYVVVTTSMRAEVVSTRSQLAPVLRAIDHSTVVAQFGTNGEHVVIRRIRAFERHADGQ
jgi:hypothetical protein